MPGVLASPASATAAKDRRLAPAPCVVGEDLGAGFGPLDLVELVSAVRVHFEGLPSVGCFAVSLAYVTCCLEPSPTPGGAPARAGGSQWFLVVWRSARMRMVATVRCMSTKVIRVAVLACSAKIGTKERSRTPLASLVHVFAAALV